MRTGERTCESSRTRAANGICEPPITRGGCAARLVLRRVAKLNPRGKNGADVRAWYNWMPIIPVAPL